MKKLILSLLIVMFSASIAYAQDAVNLDRAIQDIAYYFNRQLPAHSVVLVLNITSEHQPFSSYIIDGLIDNIITLKNLIPVDRNNLEGIKTEIQFNLSGYVSDESAQAIGKMLGAETVISGEIALVTGRMYQLRVRAVNVETTEIRGTVNRNIIIDRKVEILTGNANNFPVSIGAGIRLGGVFTEGRRHESGRDLIPSFGPSMYNFIITEATGRNAFDVGAFIFLDLKYASINMGLHNSFGNMHRSWNKDFYYYDNSVMYSESENSKSDSSVLLFNIGGFLKYPFNINRITIFPAVGAEYHVWISQTENNQRVHGNLSANNALWLQFGGGIDYKFSRSVFIRGNLLWGIKLDSRNERRDAFSYFTHGPTLNIGIGYIFNQRTVF